MSNIIYCATCKEPGHSRRTSRHCKMNPLNQNNIEDPMENVRPSTSENQLSASENSICCSSCNEPGHLRRTSRHCRMNPLNQISDVPMEDIQPSVNVISADLNRCNSCNETGHNRRTSHLCRFYSRNQTQPLHNIARDPQAVPTVVDDRGLMNVSCSNCQALMWIDERARSSLSRPVFQLCCDKGNTIFNPFKPTPPEICELLKGRNGVCKEFKKNIRSYNSSLSFTSMGVNLDLNLANENISGGYTFRIQGSPYHLIGSAIPRENENPKFAQIYIYDTEHELSNRHSIASHLSIETLNELQQLMHRLNPFVESFKSMIEIANEQQRNNESNNNNNNNNFGVNNLDDIKLVFRAEGLPDRRRYNRPTTDSEVGVIIIGGEGDDDSTKTSVRDVVVKMKDDSVRKISERNQFYDPLHYVLLFPQGDPGWNINLTDITYGKKVSPMDYYSFRLMYRPQDGHLLHSFGKLFHQYIVDMYAKMEQNRLSYIRHNQTKLRCEHYQGLQDVLNVNDNNDNLLSSTGLKVILPSTFIGGPRHMAQLYQDALNIVRRFGKPDFFITFTCNPSWEEIQRELINNQKASDRPDLCARVFNLKLRELMNDLTKNHVLGKVTAFIYTIEFQKRGLPHAHILLIIDPEDKIQTPEDLNKVVSAEIPDPILYPLAHKTVSKNMIHGPCGTLNNNAICMDRNTGCTKQYPKDFSEETVINVNSGYPIYRRRNNGSTIQKVVDGHTVNIDNRWIVPHNLYLCSKYNAHTNVELCSSINSIKYVYKYVYKGHDRASLSVEQNDEIRSYIDARYVSAPEACWRFFAFPIHKEFPAHQRLAIHLEGENPIYFREDDDISDVMARAMTQETTLTGWFKINAIDYMAKTILYPNFPEHYVWHDQAKPKKWTRRLRGFGATIGRVYSVSPKQTEKYYLRMILYHVAGATSFKDLKTVNSFEYETFQDAARALGLLTSDNQWFQCLEEAVSVQSPISLRKLYCVLLIFCEPANPFELWTKFKHHLSEDYIHQLTTTNSNNNTNLNITAIEEIAYNNCLLDIEDILVGQHSSSLSNYSGFILPTVDNRNNQEDTSIPRVIREQERININAQRRSSDFNIHTFNTDQRIAYDSIIQCVINDRCKSTMHPRIFFIDGPGGTGKTYLFNSILNFSRLNQGEYALAVASSGTAALLLDGGRTAHSTLKIPLVITHTSMCNIKPNSNLADLLRKTKIIIWDESSMISRNVFEAVDRTFKDIFSKDDPYLESVPFGGRLMVFGGDFRQVLPVIPNGSRSNIVNQCINCSFLWKQVKVLKLRVNMRVKQAQISNDIALSTELQQFADMLLALGDGRTETLKLCPQSSDNITNTDYVRIPDSMLISGSNLLNLLCYVYPEYYSTNPAPIVSNNDISLVNKAILTPKNSDVAEINKALLSNFPGDEVKYLSADSTCDEGLSITCPPEYLNSIESGSLPPHILSLKVGCPIMLLRNLDTSNGLCNGTRLIVKSLLRNIIEATIATGSHIGNIVCIPKIKLISTGSDSEIQFKRCQFPVRLAFAMTINKAQGQTLDRIGLYLPKPVFTHGQLYVAFSRVKTAHSIKILLNQFDSSLTPELSKCYTRNVVYSEVFDNN